MTILLTIALVLSAVASAAAQQPVTYRLEWARLDAPLFLFSDLTTGTMLVQVVPITNPIPFGPAWEIVGIGSVWTDGRFEAGGLFGRFSWFGDLDDPEKGFWIDAGGTSGHALTRFLASARRQVTVAINIMRGTANPGSDSAIPVAILTSDTIDATTVKPSTVRFGRTGTEAAPVNFALRDINGDGRLDMVLEFNARDTGIVCGDTSASLTGTTLSKTPIAGSDSLRAVGCGGR